VARWWLVLSLAGSGVLAWGVGLPARSAGDALSSRVEWLAQLGLLGLVALAWLLAARRPGPAAVILALAAAGLAGVAALEYEPAVAWATAVAFAAPAVMLWLVWQQDRPVGRIVALAVVTAGLLGAMGTVSARLHDRYFGPAHPSSTTPDVPVDRVEWIWSGGVTTDRAVVVARLADEIEAAALDVRPVSGGRRHAVVRDEPDDDRIVRWEVDGLEPATAYRYAVVVDGDRDDGRGVGRLRTAPAGPRWLTVAVSACARTGSDGAVFDAIRAVRPDLYVVDGDLHYGNVTDADSGTFLELYGRVLTAPAQAALYRSVPVAYVWDDHDYGTNDADASSPSRDAARTAYRQAVPHHPLPSGSGPGEPGAIYQGFTMGRVRFLLTDTRSERSGTSMLGRQQRAWLLDELRTASRTHALVVWVNPDPWIAPAEPDRDDWGGYAEERELIADAIAETGTRNLVMLSGDAHMVALDDGTNSDYSRRGGGGFPVLHAAALDRPGRVKGGPYSDGTFPGAGQFGTLSVSDDGGTSVTVTLAGRDWTGRTLVTRSFRVTVPPPA
jgi:phosphodiesterase/alkaline phosphatase D-like protein